MKIITIATAVMLSGCATIAAHAADLDEGFRKVSMLQPRDEVLTLMGAPDSQAITRLPMLAHERLTWTARGQTFVVEFLHGHVIRTKICTRTEC